MSEVVTILVTGGAGFIGSNFVYHLLEANPNWRLVILDKLTYAGNLQNLSSVYDNPRCRFIKGDICDFDMVIEAMQGCNWVVNLAAETHVDRSIAYPETFVYTDVIGTYTLLEAARSLSISRFVQVSTDEVYGNALAADGTSRPSLETDSLQPMSPYAASKAGADRLAYSYWATYGLPVVITRCSNNYGPFQYPEKQLPLFIVNAQADRPLPIYGNGDHTRDWIHVSDHCAALEMALTAPEELVNGEVFNIGTGEESSVLENAQLVLNLLTKPQNLIRFVPDRPGHVHRHAVDTTKIQRVLGWQPKTHFHEGLAETVRWYQAHKSWLEQLLARKDDFLLKALVSVNAGVTSPEKLKNLSQ